MMAGRELKTAEVENVRTRRGFGKRLESIGAVARTPKRQIWKLSAHVYINSGEFPTLYSM